MGTSLSEEVAGAVTETPSSCFLGHYQSGLNLAPGPEMGAFASKFLPHPCLWRSGLCPAASPASAEIPVSL